MKKFITGFVLLTMLMCGFSSAEEVDTDETIRLNRYVTDSIDSGSEADYFHFDLSKQGSVQIEFEFDVKGTYEVWLYDEDNNKEIQYTRFYTNYNTTSGKETLCANKLRLPSGDYKIRVASNSEVSFDENYKIKVNYVQESKNSYETEPNNDAKSAIEIEVNEAITGNLQSDNDRDYYMVELPHSGKMQVELEFYYEGAYDVRVYRQLGSDLNEIQSKRVDTQTKPYGDEYFSMSFDKMRVPAGTYYIQISNSHFSNEDYNLTVYYNSERYGNCEKEINNEVNSANEMYNNVAYVGNLNSDRDVDYYFGYLNMGEAYIELEGVQGAEYYLDIFKETLDGRLETINGNKLIKEGNRYTIKELNESGRYYFKVGSRRYSNEDYSIKFVNNIYAPVYQGAVQIDLQIGNKYMNVNGVGRLIDNNGTMPVLSSGRTMLPIRAVIEALGGTIEWDNDTFTTTLKIDNKNVRIKIGEKVAYVNGVAKSLDVPSQLINQRTMLPLRFVMENLGASVTWDDATQIVVIKK